MHVHTERHPGKREGAGLRPAQRRRKMCPSCCVWSCVPSGQEGGREKRGWLLAGGRSRCSEFDSSARNLGQVRPTFNTEVRLKEKEGLPGTAAPVVWEGTGGVRRPWRREQAARQCGRPDAPGAAGSQTAERSCLGTAKLLEKPGPFHPPWMAVGRRGQPNSRLPAVENELPPSCGCPFPAQPLQTRGKESEDLPAYSSIPTEQASGPRAAQAGQGRRADRKEGDVRKKTQNR